MDRKILDSLKKLDYFSKLKILHVINEIKNLSSEELEFLVLINNATCKDLLQKGNKND